MTGYIAAGIVAVLGIALWWLEHRARTRAETNRAAAEAMFKETQDALAHGDTRAIGRVLDWLRTRK